MPDPQEVSFPPRPQRKPPSLSVEQKRHLETIKWGQQLERKRQKDELKEKNLSFDRCTERCKDEDCKDYCRIERDEDLKIIQNPFDDKSSEKYKTEKWFGNGGPICHGKCPSGWEELERSDCWIGEKVKCGLPRGKYEDVEWYGKGPWCKGECPPGTTELDSTRDKCRIGRKVQCGVLPDDDDLDLADCTNCHTYDNNKDGCYECSQCSWDSSESECSSDDEEDADAAVPFRRLPPPPPCGSFPRNACPDGRCSWDSKKSQCVLPSVPFRGLPCHTFTEPDTCPADRCDYDDDENKCIDRRCESYNNITECPTERCEYKEYQCVEKGVDVELPLTDTFLDLSEGNPLWNE